MYLSNETCKSITKILNKMCCLRVRRQDSQCHRISWVRFDAEGAVVKCGSSGQIHEAGERNQYAQLCKDCAYIH